MTEPFVEQRCSTAVPRAPKTSDYLTLCRTLFYCSSESSKNVGLPDKPPFTPPTLPCSSLDLQAAGLRAGPDSIQCPLQPASVNVGF